VAHDEADDFSVDFTDNRTIDVRILIKDAGNLALVVFAMRLTRNGFVNCVYDVKIVLLEYAYYTILIWHLLLRLSLALFGKGTVPIAIMTIHC